MISRKITKLVDTVQKLRHVEALAMDAAKRAKQLPIAAQYRESVRQVTEAQTAESHYLHAFESLVDGLISDPRLEKVRVAIREEVLASVQSSVGVKLTPIALAANYQYSCVLKRALRSYIRTNIPEVLVLGRFLDEAKNTNVALREGLRSATNIAAYVKAEHSRIHDMRRKAFNRASRAISKARTEGAITTEEYAELRNSILRARTDTPTDSETTPLDDTAVRQTELAVDAALAAVVIDITKLPKL